MLRRFPMVGKVASILARESAVNLNYAIRRLWGIPARFSGAVQPPLEHDGVGIVRLDLIGDFVLFTAALKHYRRLYPNLRICLIGNTVWSDLAHWLNENHIVTKGHRLFDDFLGVEPGRLVRLGYFNRTAAALSRFGTVINASASRSNAVDKLVATNCGMTIALMGDNCNMFGMQRLLNNRLYRKVVANCPNALEIERNIHLVRTLGDGREPPLEPPRWDVPKRLISQTVERFSSQGFDLNAPYLVVSPFTSTPLKQWPVEKFAEVVDEVLGAHHDLRIVLLGDAPHAGESRLMTDAVSERGRVTNLVGKTTLVEAVLITANAKVSLSGDSAASHIASAVGTDCVAVLGGGHSGRFFPYPSPFDGKQNIAVMNEMDCYNCNWFCKYRVFRHGPAPCVEDIPTEAVLGKLWGTMELCAHNT